MSEILKSCAVAPQAERNYATLTTNDATSSATSPATIDLFALSTRVLARCNATGKATINVKNELQYKESNATQSISQFDVSPEKSCVVALHRDRNHATTELRHLIKKISAQYGGDDEDFLEEYIDEVIKESAHDLDAAVACFRSLCVDEIK